MNFFRRRPNNNHYLKNHFDNLKGVGFHKEYFTRNGEEEIIFTLGEYVIEIYHWVGSKTMEIDVVVQVGNNRQNLYEFLYGVKKAYDTVDEAMIVINEFIKRNSI